MKINENPRNVTKIRYLEPSDVSVPQHSQSRFDLFTSGFDLSLTDCPAVCGYVRSQLVLVHMQVHGGLTH